MTSAPDIVVSSHDDLPQPESTIVDEGIGAYNDEAAPLHEVRPLSCFARDAQHRVVGGAVGRSWGAYAEIQQLWVDPGSRGRGIGTTLMRAFEAHARTRGCRVFALETFSFQAREFYESLGYRIEWERRSYPHGIVKYHMTRHDDDAGAAAGRR